MSDIPQGEQGTTDQEPRSAWGPWKRYPGRCLANWKRLLDQYLSEVYGDAEEQPQEPLEGWGYFAATKKGPAGLGMSRARDFALCHYPAFIPEINMVLQRRAERLRGLSSQILRLEKEETTPGTEYDQLMETMDGELWSYSRIFHDFWTLIRHRVPKQDAMRKLEYLMRRQAADGEYRPLYNGNPDYFRYLVDPPTGIHESLHTLMSSDWTRWLFKCLQRTRSSGAGVEDEETIISAESFDRLASAVMCAMILILIVVPAAVMLFSSLPEEQKRTMVFVFCALSIVAMIQIGNPIAFLLAFAYMAVFVPFFTGAEN